MVPSPISRQCHDCRFFSGQPKQVLSAFAEINVVANPREIEGHQFLIFKMKFGIILHASEIRINNTEAWSVSFSM